MNRQGIIVLGMHRSGTSLTAKIIAQWGAEGKEAAMVGADATNPDGHWEYAPLVSFNDELLRAVDSSWNVPPRDAHKELLAALALDSDYRSRAIQLLEQMQTEGRPWFWKDPRLSILLPFWKPLWGSSVAYVIANRDPSDIAVSLKSRDGFSALTSFLLWERYLSEIMADDVIRSEGCFISYERLLKDPGQECTRLCGFLDREFDIRHSDGGSRPTAMAAAVVPSLRRSRSRAFSNNPLATLAQKTLYAATLRRSDDLTQEWRGSSISDPSWREQLALTDHLLKTSGRDRCQVFWRNSTCGYEERRSTWAFIKAQAETQSIQLTFPPQQAREGVFLRVDFSQRPGFLHLIEMRVNAPSGEIVWEWDGQSESIRNSPRNQIEDFANSPMGQRGLLLRLKGDDPWIEITLNPSQSTTLAKGGTLCLACSYLSIEETLWAISAGIQAEIGALRSTVKKLQGLNAQAEQNFASTFDSSVTNGEPCSSLSGTQDGGSSATDVGLRIRAISP